MRLLLPFLAAAGCHRDVPPPADGAAASSPGTDHPGLDFPAPLEAWSDSAWMPGLVFGLNHCARHFDGNVIASPDATTEAQLTARDATTGETLWTSSLGIEAPGDGFPVSLAQAGTSIVTQQSNLLVTESKVLDESSGELLFDVADDGALVAVDALSAVTCELDPAVPCTRRELTSFDQATPIAVSDVYSVDGGVLAYDRAALLASGSVLDMESGELSDLAGLPDCIGEQFSRNAAGGPAPFGPRLALACSGGVALEDAATQSVTLVTTEDKLADSTHEQVPGFTDTDVFGVIGPDDNGLVSICDYAIATGLRRWCSPVPVEPTEVYGAVEPPTMGLYADDSRVYVWVTTGQPPVDAWSYTDPTEDTHVLLLALDQADGSISWLWNHPRPASRFYWDPPCVPERLGPRRYLYVMDDEQITAIDPDHFAQ